jgi:hypothetical protein
MAQDPKITRVTTFLTIGFFAIFFGILMIMLGIGVGNSENSDLSQNSKDYINSLAGYDAIENDSYFVGDNIGSLNTSVYSASVDDPSPQYNTSNDKDFALEFIWLSGALDGIKKFFYIVFGLPQFVLVDLLRLPFAGFMGWFITFLNFVWSIFLVIAIIYFFMRK